MLGIAAFFFDSRIGQYVLGGLVAAGIIAAFAEDQRAKGAASAIVKVEKTNAKTVKLGDSARKRSGDPAARGVRDPYTAD